MKKYPKAKNFDIDLRIIQRGTIVRNAIRLGFNGIGIHRVFVHVDLREGQTVVWPY